MFPTPLFPIILERTDKVSSLVCPGMYLFEVGAFCFGKFSHLTFSLLYSFLFHFIMCVGISMYECLYATCIFGNNGGQKVTSNPLELGSHRGLKTTMRVLGIEVGSSESAASSINFWEVSLTLLCLLNLVESLSYL
jgi:hypothetical protein